MPFHNVPQVTINSKTSLFGGNIYSVDIDIGVAEQPTVVTVSLSNENGDFIVPKLKPITFYKISVGDAYNESCALVTTRIRKASKGRIMEAIFKDGSIILDSLNIGLRNKFGTENLPGLILVGREMHPCDFNENGIFDNTDVEKLQLSSIDPCEIRCPGDIPEKQNIVENCANREITDIFDVKYSFKDLLDAIEGKTPSFTQPDRNIKFIRPQDKGDNNQTFVASLPPADPPPKLGPNKPIKIIKRPAVINTNFLKNYTGSLRSVLKNWCADFGWTFYWENGGLNFVDVKERPKINFSDYSNLESTVEEQTLEGTVSKGFISHYAEPGILADQNCGESKPYMLRCFNLKDLYGEYYKPAWNAIAINDKNNRQISTPDVADIELEAPTQDNTNNQNIYLDDFYQQGVPILEFEKMCVLSFYSNLLRNLYMFWGYYGIKDAQTAENNKNKWMDRFGQRKILRVFDQDIGSTEEHNFYIQLKSNGLLLNTGTKIISDELLKRIDDWGGYFIVTGQNSIIRENEEDLLDKQFKVEENLSTNFIGQHWFRLFTSAFHGSNPQIEPAGEYIAALSMNIENIPFAQFNHTYKSNISKIVNSFVAHEQKQDYQLFGNKKWFGGNIANSSKNKKNLRSMLYLQRQDASSKWQPIKNALTSLASTLKEFSNFSPVKIDLSSLSVQSRRQLVAKQGQLLEGIKESDIPYIELWAVFPGNFEIDESLEKNPYEELPSKAENLAQYSLLTYGLLSRQCAQYSFSVSLLENENDKTPSQDVKILLPAGGSVLHDEQQGITGSRKISFSKRWATSGIDFSIPGYKVIVTETAKNRGIIPKFESTLVTPPSTLDVLEVYYDIEEINKETAIKYLNNLTVDCRIPPEEILKLHKLLSSNLNYSVDDAYVSKEYVIYNIAIPDGLTIKTGLEAISLSWGSDGARTNVKIGNSLFVLPSRDFALKNLETFLPSLLYNARKNLL